MIRGLKVIKLGATLLAMIASVNVLACQSAWASDPFPSKPTDEQLEFFEKKIRPIFVENCYICHSEHHKEAGGLRVDDFRAITNEGKNGSAVVPGNSAKSLLIQRVAHADDKKIMPPDNRLSESQVADLKKWIDGGAAWPPLVIPEGLDQTLESGATLHEDLKQNHWSWQPLKQVTAPEIAPESPLASWGRSEVDQFIAAKLQENNLRPVGDANKAVLLRRLSYDLTGLPPTQSELLEFLLDDSPQSIETVVDRLLDSKAYGERWGRHWLDIARYGESTGSARNLPYPHAWRYRDYVIASFNADKPYDQFIQEQIAGDLLPSTSLSQKREQFVATGFLALGVKDVNQRFKVRYDMDNVDEQIDAVSRSVLALTVSCARCHDHKFDPISSRDYYALAGIFASTELCDALRNQMGGSGLAYYVPERLISLGEPSMAVANDELKQQIEIKRAELEAARGVFTGIRDSVKQSEKGEGHAKKLQQARQAMQRKQAELVALTDPAKNGPVAIGVRDAKKVADTEIRIRGEAEKLGPAVPRGFLSVLDQVPSKPIGTDQSGRYELAKWLTERSNPLTSRVAVNRIWQRLFAEGIVRTVDNFGSTGDEPSHAELLDFLANKFVQDGWSYKKLIKYLVLSRTYQLSSASNADAIAVDPANRWLWRHSPRRLEAEEIRDSILSVAGKLDRSVPEGSSAKDLPVIEIRNNGKEAKYLLTAAGQSTRRSVYLPLVRGVVPNSLEVFDFAEQSLVTGKRANTTVAPQALYLLNDAFVRKHSLILAQNLLQDNSQSSTAKINNAYRLILNRQPVAAEVQRATAFVQDFKMPYTALQTSKPLEPAQLAQANTDVPESVSATSQPLAGSSSNAATAPSVTATEPNKPTEVTGEKNRAEKPAEKKKKAAPDIAAAAPEDARDSELDMDVSLGDLQPKNADDAALMALVQSLLSSAEFRYVR